MKTSLLISLTTTILLASGPSAHAQQAQRGTVLGGLAGAGIGAIIGDNNDNTAAGALIGGAVGAIAGGALGSANQREAMNQQMYREQQYYQQVSSAVSSADVMAMCQNNVSPDVIVGMIRQRGVQQRLEVADIIRLHQAGVSDYVISEMQRANVAGTVRATPVVVHEYYNPRPVVHVSAFPGYGCGPYHYHHAPPCHGPRSGWSVGFGGAF